MGRDEELELLLDGFDRPDRRGVVLAGPAGVGKSRLAREAVEAAAVAGWVAERVVGTEGLDEIPFGAVTHLLPEPLGADPDHLRIVTAISDSLGEVAADGRLALLVDDAHLLDDRSAALVQHLARSGRAYVVATVRAQVPVPDPITALWKDGLAVRIDLSELSEIETDDLVRAVLGGRLDGTTRRRIWSITRGNPLFLRELVLTAVAERTMREQDGTWRLDPDATPGARLAELVESRLRRLDEGLRAALEVLAVAEPLSLRTFTEVVGDRAAVAELERRGSIVVVKERRRRIVRMEHPMHRETLRAALPETRVMEVQRRLADVVAGMGARRRDDPLRVAFWRLDAGGPADVSLLAEAAATALRRFDHPLALRLSRAAMEGGGGIEPALTHAASLIHLHAPEEAERVLSEHEAEARAAPSEPRRRYLDLRTRALLFHLGRTDDAVVVVERFADAGDDRDWAAWIDVMRLRCGLAMSRFREHLDRVAEIARDETIDPEVRSGAMETAAEGYWYVGRSATALELFDLAIALAGDDLAELLRLEYQRLGPYHHTGPRAMEATAADMYERALDAGWHHGAFLWAQAIGVGHLLAGRAEQACRWLREAVAQGERSDPSGYLPLSIAQLAIGEAMGGRVEEARQLQRRARDLAGTEAPYLRSAMAAADLYIALAERRLTDAVDLVLERIPQVQGNVFSESSSLHTALRVGADPGPVAERLAELAAGVESDLIKTWARQAVAVHEGDGRVLEEVCDVYVAIDNPVWAAEAAAQAALAYAAEGKQDSARRAAVRSQRAREGVEGVWTPAMDLREGPEPLRPREREVAELAAAGKSNGEIAETLGISPRTVETHLQRAYLKLGVNRREDLGAVLPPS